MVRSDKPSGIAKGVRRKDTWNVHLKECIDFKEENGHCKIPTRYKENRALGNWVQNQRRKYKQMWQVNKNPRRGLSQEQIKALNDIGFYWGSSANPSAPIETDESWEDNYEKLEGYKIKHGDFNIKWSPDNKELFHWVRLQRYLFKQNEITPNCLLAKERIELLNEIGFNWN